MEKKNEYWYYIVRQFYTDVLGNGSNYFEHKEKAVALHRATRYMEISIENLCSNYRMGKLPAELPHKIIFQLCYAESFDGGNTYEEIILEEKRLLQYLGIIPKQ